MNFSMRRGIRIGVCAALLGALLVLCGQRCAGQGPIDPTGVRGLDDGDPLSRPLLPAGAEEAPSASFQRPGEPIRTEPQPQAPPRPGEPPATPIEGGEIIARVDGQVILVSDVAWQANLMIATNNRPIPPEHLPEVRRQLLQQLVLTLIDTKLLYADFKRTVPAENLPKISEQLSKPFEEAEIPRLKKMFRVNDRAEIETRLNQSGTSLKDIQQQFMERTVAQEWMRQKVPKPKPVTHEEMLEYYQQHLSEYQYDAQVKWEELMVRFDRFNGDRDAAWAALAKMGNDAWATGRATPSAREPAFTDVAKANSHGFTADKGGLYDWRTQGSLACNALNEALATLPLGEMSSGIESDMGFHIVRVLDRKPAGATPFTDAQTKIREKLEADQRTRLFKEELAKVRKEARVWTLFDGDLSGDRLAQLLDKEQ